MKRSLYRILSVFFILLAMGMTVCAADAENIKKSRVFQTINDVELHEKPDAASAIIGTLSSGTPVIVKEDAKDGWCMVAYQETVGYVEVSFLGILGSQIMPAAAEVPNVTASESTPADGAVPDHEAQSADGAVQNNEAQPNDGAAQNDDAQSAGGAAQVALVNAEALDEEFKIVQEENLLAYQEAEAAKEQAKSNRIWGIVIAVLVIAIFAVGIVTTLVGNKGKRKIR